MSRQKCIALIAHDEKKDDMVSFAQENENVLAQAKIFATGTTGGTPRLHPRQVGSGMRHRCSAVHGPIASGQAP